MKKGKIIALVILIIVFIFCVSKLVIYRKDLKENKEDNKDLVEDVVDIKIDEETKEEKVKIDFDKLKKTNSDIIGWMIFNNKKINNPIVHTKDNSYYLTKSFNKKYNQAGTIFMDYRNKSLDDRNVVLFGHAMTDGTMFGSLVDIFKKDFLKTKENNYIQIINKDNEILTYQIFSYYIIEEEEYYITTSFKNDSAFSKFIKTMKSRSRKKLNVEVNKNDKILTLSTCVGTGETTKRRVVHAKRVNN